MRVHSILPVSRANGPGSRFTIWVQGCTRKCSGCFNPETHDASGGSEFSVTEILKQITPEETGGITVSGGEPFEQAEELAALLEQAGAKGLSRLVFTGFTYEELLSKKSKAIEKCLLGTDMLIDGAYIKELPPYMPWTGSGNQRILQLEQGKVVRVCVKTEMEAAEAIDGEIIINSDGKISATGNINIARFVDYLA